MISIVRNCHIRPFSSPIIICREIFFYVVKTRQQKSWVCFSHSFRLIHMEHVELIILTFDSYPILSIEDIVRPMTPNLSANFSCDWIGFSLSDSSDSPLSNFFGLSKRSSSSKLKFPTLNLSYHFFYVL